ncbi:ScbR family autoregulator-binding transcription factor [Actinopolyspora mortivallis]|uniref:ScbR family autoregulator-binding transcription factor n=1 Tax=Actinopolyspora mortivallis TaxID=33906 RepID=UPI000527E170|nr:ScbR family autoregulator-binding transcription factor [Actinopolyspora mortivallis]
MVRQKRAERTRHSLLRAGAEVIAARGCEKASLSEILQRAGVTKGALYFHFPSKNALVRAVLEERAAVAATDSGEPYTQDLIDFTHRAARAGERDPLLRAETRMAAESLSGKDCPVPYREWSATFQDMLRRSAKAGETLPGTDPAASADTLAAAYLGTRLFWHATGQRPELREMLARLWRHLLPGLVLPATLRRLDPHGGDVSADAGATDEDSRAPSETR